MSEFVNCSSSVTNSDAQKMVHPINSAAFTMLVTAMSDAHTAVGMRILLHQHLDTSFVLCVENRDALNYALLL